MKKLVSLVLALLMVLSLGAAMAEEPAVVKIVATSDHLEHLTILAEQFNAANPDIRIEVDGTASGWDGVATKMITMLAGGEPFDIATISTSYYPQFVDLGQALDITEHAKETYSEEEYYWSVFDGLMVDGKLYGVPISVYTLVNFYNKDLYDEAGVAYPSYEWGENAWTFEDWQEVAVQLTKGEGLDRQYGVWIEYQLERTALFLFAEGLDYWGENLEPQFTNERTIEIHETLYKMLHEDKVMPNADLINTTGMDQLLADGQVANYIQGTWSHGSVAKSGINYGISPVPGGKTVGYVDVYLPMANTANPEATMKVLDYLISYETCLYKYENNIWGPQVNKKATEEVMYDAYPQLSKEDVDCLFASLDNCKPLTVFPEWAEFLDKYLLPSSSLLAAGESTVVEELEILQESACDILGF